VTANRTNSGIHERLRLERGEVIQLGLPANPKTPSVIALNMYMMRRGERAASALGLNRLAGMRRRMSIRDRVLLRTV